MLNALERLIAGLALMACSPVIALLALAIVLENGFPVLFRQDRVGEGGRIFRLIKLRSMRSDVRGSLITASGDARVTRAGGFLRKYKLDELPQLWNILLGDMRFVGPRPELPSLVNRQDPLWRAVLSGKPGLTDLATLVYRNEENVLAQSADPEKAYREEILPEKLALSVAYQKTRNLWSDSKLLLLSARYSFLPDGFRADKVRRTFVETE